MKKNKGFTLVELIVVVAIIAIIASVASLALIKYVRKARRVKDVQYAGEIQEAIDRAIIEHEAGTGVDELGWQYSAALAWNKNSKVRKPPQNVLDYAFNELGRMPAPNTNEDWFWIVSFDPETGKVSKIELAPSLMGRVRYEVWPDYEDFMEMKK